jgi:Protein of unknown function (DUF2877)
VIAAGAAPVRPIAIGASAHAALGSAGGVARVLARLTASTYLTAGDQITWLGAATVPLHPRAILVADAPIVRTDELQVLTEGLSPWHPCTPRLDVTTAGALIGSWGRLLGDVARLGMPAGFGVRLAGRTPGWPLTAAAATADTLASACARDDPADATAAAVALLGVGGGLTPSGDDFVGGTLFARRLLAEAGLVDSAAWRHTAHTILAAAPSRTHAISVALLGDLAAGLGWAPLHDLVAALVAGASDTADAAARRLVRLGHTSGWDLLAGLGVGLGTRS